MYENPYEMLSFSVAGIQTDLPILKVEAKLPNTNNKPPLLGKPFSMAVTTTGDKSTLVFGFPCPQTKLPLIPPITESAPTTISQYTPIGFLNEHQNINNTQATYSTPTDFQKLVYNKDIENNKIALRQIEQIRKPYYPQNYTWTPDSMLVDICVTVDDGTNDGLECCKTTTLVWGCTSRFPMFKHINIAPNPVGPTLTLNYELTPAALNLNSPLKIDLYDRFGNHKLNLKNTTPITPEEEITTNVSHLNADLYYIILQINETMESIRFIKK